jgi:hypothetical protein
MSEKIPVGVRYAKAEVFGARAGSLILYDAQLDSMTAVVQASPVPVPRPLTNDVLVVIEEELEAERRDFSLTSLRFNIADPSDGFVQPSEDGCSELYGASPMQRHALTEAARLLLQIALRSTLDLFNEVRIPYTLKGQHPEDTHEQPPLVRFEKTEFFPVFASPDVTEGDASRTKSLALDGAPGSFVGFIMWAASGQHGVGVAFDRHGVFVCDVERAEDQDDGLVLSREVTHYTVDFASFGGKAWWTLPGDMMRYASLLKEGGQPSFEEHVSRIVPGRSVLAEPIYDPRPDPRVADYARIVSFACGERLRTPEGARYEAALVESGEASVSIFAAAVMKALGRDEESDRVREQVLDAQDDDDRDTKARAWGEIFAQHLVLLEEEA